VAETWLDYCQGWFDANSAYITKDAGNLVSTWTNQAPADGAVRDLTQGTAAQQPLWVDAVINGYPVVRFDGAATTPDNLQNTSFCSTGWPLNFYLVGQVVSQPTGTYTLLDGAGMLRVSYAGSKYWTFSTTQTSLATPANGVPVIVKANFIDGACALRVSGTAASATYNVAMLSVTGLCLGSDVAVAHGANFDIAEVIYLGGKLPFAVDSSLMSYLANKYGIAI
jgi:hypothetical protein